VLAEKRGEGGLSGAFAYLVGLAFKMALQQREHFEIMAKLGASSRRTADIGTLVRVPIHRVRRNTGLLIYLGLCVTNGPSPGGAQASHVVIVVCLSRLVFGMFSKP
jgi:hypothetical protein